MSMHETRISGPPPADEYRLLAELAFASRPQDRSASRVPRHLAFLPPDALDMDLFDPMQRDFGDYELCEKLGQGGMGVVYRAHQRSLDRDVALKLLAAGPWASRDFIDRFRREAQSAARLEHPNIVTVFETGEQHDLHYFSMRLIRGESLAARLAREGPLPPRQAARLLRVVADALDYAHRLGVLHLDLKPGNVLIDEAGEPMVADFGLARRVDQALAEQTDDVSGTPSYMAPEQVVARSQQIGRATDVYGLGSILYEMLTGRPPFLGVTARATLTRVVQEPVQSPRQHVASIPLDIEAICLKCLCKDPEQRYSTVAALADDLRRFLEDRPVSVRRPGVVERIRGWRRREPRLAAAALALVVALAGGFAVSSHQWLRAEQGAKATRNLLWAGRQEAALQLEQEGRGFDALPRLVANLREQEASGATASIAQERRRIGLLTGQGVTLIDRILIDDANPLAVEVSPDGERVAIALNDQSVRWYDSATMRERGRVDLSGRISSGGQERPLLLLRFVDEHHLRVTAHWLATLANPVDGDTWLIDLSASSVREPPAFMDFADATYSPDGRHALLRDRSMRSQYWQVHPWRALSELTAPAQAFDAWVLDPAGRFALLLQNGQQELVFHALPSLVREFSLTLPGNAGVSAWSMSADGRSLALGDYEGRVFVFDTQRRSLRALPASRGREITWLGFSEDGSWLACGSFDGRVLAFDVASGDALSSMPMQHDFVPRRVAVSRARRLLIASGDGKVALWRLPPAGKRAVPAQRIRLGPAPHALAAPYAIGWSLRSGLLVSAGIDGQVRLWRLPLSPVRDAIAAREVSERTDFDGQHLVDVEWNRLRIAPVSGAGSGDWLELPQPPGFAELLAQGRLLGVTLGAELRFYRVPGLRPSGAPITLENTPQRWISSPDGKRLLLTFAVEGAEGFSERLELYDLRQRVRVGGTATLRGPLRQLAYSNDSQQLLAVGPADAATTVLDANTLALLGEFVHDPFEPVQRAAFSLDGGTVWLVTLPPDARVGNDLALQWRPRDDQILRELSLENVRPLGVIDAPAGILVAGVDQDVLFHGGEKPRILPRLAGSTATALLVLSPDATVLARGFQREVQLHDARTGEPIGLPLQADSKAVDLIVQLAFSPDSTQLLARTVQGNWLHWPIAAERRSASELAGQIESVSVARESQRVLVMPTESERRSLRRHDPGRWQDPVPRPEPEVAARTPRGDPIPQRTVSLPEPLLDLSAVYDRGPDTSDNTFHSIAPQLRPMPAGLQRFGGVDFDIRGMRTVGQASSPHREDADAVLPVQCIPLPAHGVAALHLLIRSSSPLPVRTGEPMMRLQLHYSDHSTASVSLRAGIDLPGYAGDDLAVPTVFAAGGILAILGLPQQLLSAPRVANPFPDRPLRCLDLESTAADRPLLLLAITTEGTAATQNPVISAAVSPSTRRRRTTRLLPETSLSQVRRVP